MRRSPPVELGCKYTTDCGGWHRIHHCLVGAVDAVNLDLTVDVRRPDFIRWLGLALGGYEKQNIATESLWQERLHQQNAVLIAIHDGLVVMFL